jgi:uncharacterized protein YjiS (DUF1127 family)
MFSTTFAPISTIHHESVLVRTINLILLWQARAEQRSALAELDDHLLQDIGVDRATAKVEAAKPFWSA